MQVLKYLVVTNLVALLVTSVLMTSTNRAFGQGPPAIPSEALEVSEGVEATATPDASPGANAIPTKNMLSVVREAGMLFYPIAFCSLLLFVFIFERLISLRRSRVIPKPFVKRFIEQLEDGQLKQDEALQRCEENRSPVAELFAAAVKKWGKPAVEVEQAIIDSGERVTNGLRRYLRLFEGISTISPLLGLLGTVVGMITAFNAIATADAMGTPELLAGGISQALLTTAAGLSVAIPAYIAYLFFASRVDRLIIEIDSLGHQVVNLIATDGWKELPSKSSTKNKKKAA